jgi:hypothetical protein
MTIDELVNACSEISLVCDRCKVLRLTKDGLLEPPVGGGRGRGNVAYYTERTLLRLKVLLALEQPHPSGFDAGTARRKLAWIGAVGDERTLDEFLPAVAFILGIPRADAEQARETGLRFLRRRYRESLAMFRKIETEIVDRLDAMKETDIEAASMSWSSLAKALGRKETRNPDYYAITEPYGHTPPLRDTITGALFPKAWRPLVDANDLVISAQAERISLHYLAVKSADHELLGEAAHWARWFTPSEGGAGTPQAETLLTLWGFYAAALLYAPGVRTLLRQTRQTLEMFSNQQRLSERIGELIKSTEFSRFARAMNLDGMAVIITNELLPVE